MSKPFQRRVAVAAALIVQVVLSAAPFQGRASAATAQIEPEVLVRRIYDRLIADEHNSPSRYDPPETIFTPRLKSLVAAARRKAKGDIPCGLDFLFWVNGQDYAITDLKVERVASSTPGSATVIATFRNIDRREKIVFDFKQLGARWLLNDASSVEGKEKWTFSKLLRCES